ncbi:efflux RND transporter periplasmic adaptor subunit [Parashewanella spongiae]|uniref:Efflux RND transporter periplasmic adaptor subunit n=1 Tax=Parashewanella spongiae TaxID=342950 RepID=A0A3A6UIN5_9GAMM|nr:efflux RND transporter periplasmic adaptor subunit [Parashewanella spongiae]MCL1076938.1 efflux RND transporter periplasmic adaptor subunit [Parashewanella spongiae]RJY18945.1 efflux RND transporter periplasmic adaptor subunit [Parashewanella spongiae]
MSNLSLWLRRILLPVSIIVIAAFIYAWLTQSKAYPEQKSQKPSLPIVEVMEVNVETSALTLASFGVVQPKYKTRLVAEVSGRIVHVEPIFISGGMVSQGDVLARIEASDYQADLALAEAELAKARASLDEEKARGEVAKVEFKDYKQGSAPTLGLRLPQLQREQANVKSAEAVLARAKRNLERTLIRAQFDGLVKTRSIDLGQYVSVGSELGELFNTDIAEVRLPVSFDDMTQLNSIQSPNAPVRLTSTVGQQTFQWQAELVRSEGVIDDENRMLYVVAEINDPYQRAMLDQNRFPLQFGTFVDAEIQGKQVEQLVKLPRHLVRDNQVAVIDAANKIAMRDVNIVKSGTEFIYIQGSLKSGERISLAQFNQLSNGLEVSILGDKADEVQGQGMILQGER